MRRKLFFFGPLAILGFAVFTAVVGAIVRLLWNALLPPLFGWPAVTFWQALGLLVLSRILFGGFGWRRCGRGRLKEDERERLRQRLRERSGFDHPAGGTPAL
jgi:hypothetical protein